MAFTAEQVTLRRVIHLAAAPNRVFPLFEPIGEKAWAEGWEPHMLFPADGTPQQGAVFSSTHATGVESIWTMPVYDPASLHLAYLQVTPTVQVAFIEIQCEDLQDGTTRATYTYTLTGLSAAGNERVAHFSASYQDIMDSWEKAINFYLAHGHAMKHH